MISGKLYYDGKLTAGSDEGGTFVKIEDVSADSLLEFLESPAAKDAIRDWIEEQAREIADQQADARFERRHRHD